MQEEGRGTGPEWATSGQWEPGDAISDLIESVREAGWDISKTRTVTHDVSVPTEAGAEAIARDVHRAGYRVESTDEDADYKRWVVRISHEIVVTVDAVMAARSRLDELAAPFGGRTEDVTIAIRDEERSEPVERFPWEDDIAHM